MRKHKCTNKQMIPGTHMHGRTQAHTPLCQRFTHCVVGTENSPFSLPPVCERDTMRVINKPKQSCSTTAGYKDKSSRHATEKKKKITSTF